MRKDDSSLEDELEYFPNITPIRDEGEAKEDRWWSPEPCGLRSEEEDEEDNRYINSILSEDCEVSQDLASASTPQGCEDKNSKVWPVKPLRNRDTSTNTGVLGSRGQSRPLKPAAVSFREERARWEWPRRATSADRQNRWMHRQGSRGQGSLLAGDVNAQQAG
jgi:hypothetical protein